MFPVEAFRNTLSKLTAILRILEIRFHLTGGVAGTAYGEPRMTQDIDIVVDPLQTRSRLDQLVAHLRLSDFLFDETSLRTAVARGGMFQLLDNQEVLKLDIYPRELITGELDRSELLEIFAGEWLPVVSRTDAALSKLIWIDKGSHKSRRDVRAIFRKCATAEQDTIRRQASPLGLSRLLDEVLAEPDEIPP